MLSVDEARRRLIEAATPPSGRRHVPVSQALNLVLAGDVFSEVDVPPANNSAMDGYAFCHGDARRAGFDLPVSQRIAAGHSPSPLAAGSAARIFTGGEIPEGADTVAMQEDCRLLADGARVQIDPGVSEGANIRPRGQDIGSGERILAVGTRLRPQELGLLSSVGIARVAVYRPLRVAIFSTGDELVEPGKPLKPGQIYNSNRATLTGIVTALGMEALDLGNVPDTARATEKVLFKAAAEADVVVSSGGVSVGEEDHVKASVAKLGKVDFWKTAIKPGKPLAFGSVGGKPFLGLPGNPASVFVVGLILVRPFLLAQQGARFREPTPRWVPALFDRRGGKREEYLRARLTEKGAELFPNQSSGVLSSACWGDGLVMQPPDTPVRAGEQVMFYSYGDLLS